MFREIVIEPRGPWLKKPGPRPLGPVKMTGAQRMQRQRAPIKAMRKRCIAVLDMETDPFDDEIKADIFPFVAELYSDQFDKIVIWEDRFEEFCIKVVQAIEALPDEYTIYAHNGGKFDFMFLVSKLRGHVQFKGRAIMEARIGVHHLRDSLHLLPEPLAAWKKDKFDYRKMSRHNRYRYQQEILDYLHADCLYLFDFLKSFIGEFGLKLTIGQAAFSELKKSYKVSNVRPATDEFLRRYFFGGRVECIAGQGLFEPIRGRPDYRLYDVNSMYPYVMANFSHPISNQYHWRRGNPSDDTVFIDVECRSMGAFVWKNVVPDDSDGPGALRSSGPVDDGARRRFYTTIHEFNVATRFQLIEDVEIVGVVDCMERTDFSKFILPMYDRRQDIKKQMKALRELRMETSREFEELKKQDLFLKYLLNNAYGKFAQNPRKYKDYYYTEPDECPDDEWMAWLKDASDEDMHKYGLPVERCDTFAVWARPAPGTRFNNVGTAASITGAARSVLLEALQYSIDPIYCDTDSIIARDISGVELHGTKLGAWDIEADFNRVIIAGKKEYCCEDRRYAPDHMLRLKARCKGANLAIKPKDPELIEGPAWGVANDATWRNYSQLLEGKVIDWINVAPTFNRAGGQNYIRRQIRATANRGRTSLGNLVATRRISDGVSR